ncbi:hypothetical protein [Dactylosporangium salmoneum]|uniref:Uncharacterized protein n=1 Tax=Dactylosporangium salmoneum TaxID=53361 RepID=A0ABN3FD14_9ACTN
MHHPHTLHALAAIWSLRAALTYLPDYRDALTIQRRNLATGRGRMRTLAELHAFDTLLRAERAERAAGAMTGLKPSASPPAPVPLDLIDLEQDITSVLAAAVDIVAYANRAHPVLQLSPLWRIVIEDLGVRRGGHWRWSYLVAAIPGTPPGLCDQVERMLAEEDARLRSAMGLRPDSVPVPGAPPCPTCRERRLRVQTSAPSSARWTIVCRTDTCLCLGDGDPRAGDGCPCGMPIRARGVRHIWDASSPLASSAGADAAHRASTLTVA